MNECQTIALLQLLSCQSSDPSGGVSEGHVSSKTYLDPALLSPNLHDT